jgi:hypothetical protein
MDKNQQQQQFLSEKSNPRSMNVETKDDANDDSFHISTTAYHWRRE